jgi:hypothetical protein
MIRKIYAKVKKKGEKIAGGNISVAREGEQIPPPQPADICFKFTCQCLPQL